MRVNVAQPRGSAHECCATPSSRRSASNLVKFYFNRFTLHSSRQDLVAGWAAFEFNRPIRMTITPDDFSILFPSATAARAVVRTKKRCRKENS